VVPVRNLIEFNLRMWLRATEKCALTLQVFGALKDIRNTASTSTHSCPHEHHAQLKLNNLFSSYS
jgi:hypothetical protein